MQKDDVIAVLREMADLLEITDANSFEVRAQRNAAQGLEEWSGNLDETAAAGTLTDIPSVGKGLSAVISDLVLSGSSSDLNRVRSLVPPELPVLLRVSGLGPKRVRALWRELQVESPDDLKRAAENGQIQTLRGFGAKTVERILSGLDRLQKVPSPKAVTPAASDVRMPQAPTGNGRLLAGTSGYSYPRWKGSFYPTDARTDDLLTHYAKCFKTVEINNTFYRFPSVKVIDQWGAQTPSDFRFAIKAHRRITHQLRLGKAARDRIIEFVERCGQLGSKLGCILFQLPPDFSRDDARLATLLHSLPSGPRYAIEFRHPTWLTDEVHANLSDRQIACVAGDAEDAAPSYFVTSDFVYVRLRRGSYSEDELSTWHDWFQSQRSERRDVMVYLKHDEEGAVPKTIFTRWAQPERPGTGDLLRDTLAKPAKTKAPSRRRKRG